MIRLAPIHRRHAREGGHLVPDASEVPAFAGTTDGSDQALDGISPETATRVSPSQPGVAVNARETRLEQLHADLDSGTIKLALLYHLHMAGNIRRFLPGEMTPYTLLPEAHPLAARQAVSARDLARHPFVLIDLPGSPNAFLWIFKASGVTPPEIIRCVLLEIVLDLVASGAGVSILVTRPDRDLNYDGHGLACPDIREPVPRQAVIWPRRPVCP